MKPSVRFQVNRLRASRGPRCLVLAWLALAITGAPVSAQDGEEEPPRSLLDDRARAGLRQGLSLLSQEPGTNRVQSLVIDPNSGKFHTLIQGNARLQYFWDGERVTVRADRILILARLEEASREAGAGEAEDGGEEREGRPAGRLQPRSFYAEGNVRIEGEGAHVEADAFFHDHVRGRGLAVRARGRARLDALDRLRLLLEDSRHSFLDPPDPRGPTMGPAPGGEATRGLRPPADAPREIEYADPLRTRRDRKVIQLAFRAEFLRMLDLDHFASDSLSISTCDYGEPHFGVNFDGFELQKSVAGEDETEEERDSAWIRDDRDDYILDPEGGTFHVKGIPLLPFPIGYWNTEWLDIDANPIRDVGYSSSGKFGHRLEVAWNLNWFLEMLPGARLEPVDAFLDDSRLDIQTDYLSERGFQHGVNGIYGEHPRRWLPRQLSLNGDWSYHGQGRYTRIDDHGADRTQPRGTPDIDAVRSWAQVLHRQRIPFLGVLDVEYSERRDENFLDEYYPETRVEKEQESLFYLRSDHGDNFALTGLAKYRTDDFETVRERLPQFDLRWIEQPVFDSGLYTTLKGQAAHLRFRPGDDLTARSRRYGRLDALNEWSLPLRFGDLLFARPFASGRVTFYESGQDPTVHSLSRESLLAGTTVSQQWSRVFPISRDNPVREWFGLEALKHDIIPKVTYAHRFENTLDPAEVFAFDEVDAVDNLEVFELSLRNILWGRTRESDGRVAAIRRLRGERGEEATPEGSRPGLLEIPTVTRSVIDAEVSSIWYPRPRRDNAGDRYSLVDVDVTVSPSQHLYVRSRNFFDPNEKWEHALTDNSVTVEPLPGELRFTLGERFRPGVSEFLYGRVAVYLSRKYLLEGYYGYDLSSTERTDAELRLVRFTRCFAWEVSYSFDAGERDNHTVSFNLYPVELFRDDWDRRGVGGPDSRGYGRR